MSRKGQIHRPPTGGPPTLEWLLSWTEPGTPVEGSDAQGPCRLWTRSASPNGKPGYAGRKGYGRVMVKRPDGAYRPIGAHRLALALATGRDPFELDRNEFACHRCDRPLCVEPSHLYWGRPKDNSNDYLDAREKAGWIPKAGERAKLIADRGNPP